MTSDARPGTPRLTAGTALAAVAGLLVLSLVLPPTLASFVAGARVARARVGLSEIAAALSARRVGAKQASSALVLAGRGRLPLNSDAQTGVWLSASRGSMTAPPDPWGNAYLVRMRGVDSDRWTGASGSDDRGFRLPLLVLSAGPNGVIETAFEQPSGDFRAGGDDVGSPVREP